MTIALVAAIAVLVGIGDMPYGYYTLLRLMICGFSLFLLFGTDAIATSWQRWLTGGFAVLYNPVLPVHLGEKGIWIVVNILTAAWFSYVAVRSRTGQSR